MTKIDTRSCCLRIGHGGGHAFVTHVDQLVGACLAPKPGYNAQTLTPPVEGKGWSTPLPLTIADRAAMVDPAERAEIERQCLDAFVDDLAAALEKRELQSAHIREASGVSAALALVKVRLRIWTGTRK